jgi:hypothetical protein
MPESKKTDTYPTSGRPEDRNPFSAAALPADLAANVDAWATAHAIDRSEAIRRLVEIGLKSAKAKTKPSSQLDHVAAEKLAVTLIDQFIDPNTPREERDRRVHRLTEGPPEVVDMRIDLPKRAS